MEQNSRMVAAYGRVALFNEFAMQAQSERLRRFAEEQGIGEVVLYSDNGYSGLNFDRPAFNRLEADISNGKIRAVIALDETRIARDYFLVSGWMDKMKRAGIMLVFVNHPGNEVQMKIRQRLADAWRNDKKS